MPLYTIDGCHLKHGFATSKTALLLCSRDGNNSNVIICFGIVNSENNDDVHYFLDHVKEAGLGEHLDSEDVLLMTDR